MPLESTGVLQVNKQSNVRGRKRGIKDWEDDKDRESIKKWREKPMRLSSVARSMQWLTKPAFVPEQECSRPLTWFSSSSPFSDPFPSIFVSIIILGGTTTIYPVQAQHQEAVALYDLFYFAGCNLGYNLGGRRGWADIKCSHAELLWEVSCKLVWSGANSWAGGSWLCRNEC